MTEEVSGRRPLSLLRLALILTIVVVAPFYSGSTSPLGQAVNETLLLALAAVSFISCYVFDRRRIEFSLFSVAGIVFGLAAMLSAAFAIFRVDAWNTVGLMILLGVGYRAVRSTTAEQDHAPRLFAFAIVVSAVVQTLIAVHEVLFTSWYQSAMPEFYRLNIVPNLRGGVLRAVGGFINPNYLAAFLNFGLAIAVSLVLFGGLTFWRRITFGAGAAIIFTGIALSGSKAALGVSIAMLALLSFFKDKRILYVVLVILLLAVIVPNPVRDSVVRGVTGDPLIAMRPAIWGGAARMLAEHPILGVGPSNYQYAGHKYSPPTDFLLVRYERIARIAHDALLHSLAEFGLLGGVLLLFLLGCVVRLVTYCLFKRRFTLDPALAVGLGAAVGGLFLHSLVDNAANNRAVLVLLLFAVATLASLSMNLPPFRRRFSLRLPAWRGPLAAVAAAVLIVGFFIAQIYKPLYYEDRMQALQNGLESRLAQLEEADAGSKSAFEATASVRGYIDELGVLGQAYMDNTAVNRALGRAHRALFRRTGDMGEFLDADRAYERAAENLHGWSMTDDYYRLVLRFDLISLGYPKTGEMLNTMSELAGNMIKSWPTRAVFFQMAAAVARERGEPEQAVELLNRAIELEPNYLQAIADLGKLAVRIGDNSLTRRAAQLFAQASERIAKGRIPSDTYSRQILAPPR